MSVNPTGVIGLFLHPPIGTMVTEAIPGNPHSGFASFDRIRGPVGTDAFGIRYELVDVPPGYGIVPGPGTNIVDRVVVRVAVIHRLFDGHFVQTQGEDFRTTSGTLLFQESFPLTVPVELAPGVTANLFWLLVL